MNRLRVDEPDLPQGLDKQFHDSMQRKSEIWIGIVELSQCYLDTPSLRKNAFTVVTTWASSAAEFKDKCHRMLEASEWHLLQVETPIPLSLVRDCSDEVEEMIRETRTDPNAIIYGTLYTFPVF